MCVCWSGLSGLFEIPGCILITIKRSASTKNLYYRFYSRHLTKQMHDLSNKQRSLYLVHLSNRFYRFTYKIPVQKNNIYAFFCDETRALNRSLVENRLRSFGAQHAIARAKNDLMVNFTI